MLVGTLNWSVKLGGLSSSSYDPHQNWHHFYGMHKKWKCGTNLLLKLELILKPWKTTLEHKVQILLGKQVELFRKLASKQAKLPR